MKKLLLFFFLIFYSLLALAQEGDVPLTHYTIPIPPQNYNFNDLKIDKQGRLLVAYKKGILQFDGHAWLKIDIDSSPIKFLELNDKNFLLAKDGIYEIKEDIFHQNRLELLHKIPLISPVVDLVFYKQQYYLLANDEITVFDDQFVKVKVYQSDLGYKDVFVFGNQLYAFEDNYLLENLDGTWVDLNLFAPKNTDFTFSIKGASKLYFAYDNGDFYSFDGQDFDPYSSELNEYLRDNYPLSGKFLDQKLVISTLSGGVILVEEKSGEILSTIQNYNGLPTNEVSALTMDFQSGLWLAHPYGLSRAAFNIPLSDFQFYPGLEGLPETALKKRDTLWIGTTEGLFYLKKVKDYETLQKKLVKRVRISNPNEPSLDKADEDSGNFIENLFNLGQENSEEEVFIEEELKKYRSIYRSEGIRFKSLRVKLDKKEAELRDSIRNTKNRKKGTKQSQEAPKYRSVVKKINVSRLKSIGFEYQKIEGVDQQISSLIDTDLGLLAKSNTGLYLIQQNDTKRISNLKLVKEIFYQRDKKLLWVSNELGLFSIDLSDANYTSKKHSNNVFNDVLIKNDQLIAVGIDILEIFELNGDKTRTVKKLNIRNNFSEELVVFLEGGKVKLLRSDAILELDSSSSVLKIDSTFASPLRYFLKDQNENIWLLSAKDEWSNLKKDLSSQARKWMRIIPPVKNINIVNDTSVFFTTNQRIIRWKSNVMVDYPVPKTFIDGVIIENQSIKNDDFVKLEYGQNNLKVILSTPEYLFKEDVQYQYYVKGLMDDWSAWSKTREIDFPYIPSGDYELQIRARTVVKNEVSSFGFQFEVLPPYWRTWWFYSLEILFFSILILISIRLNTSSQSSYITKTFTFLTLILFLELIATIVENNLEGYIDESPVYTFVINVTLALSISPIEKWISRLLVIFNSSKSKQLISRMRRTQINKKNE